MTDGKKAKKDTRSAITVKLPAVYADFVVGLLARELDEAYRQGQVKLTETIRDILEPFRTAMELEARQRTMRSQTNRKMSAKEQNQINEQGGQKL